jgi:hypothetical protein
LHQDHIGSLNWGYRVALREKNVTYINAYGTFIDAHTIKTVDKKNREVQQSPVTTNARLETNFRYDELALRRTLSEPGWPSFDGPSFKTGSFPNDMTWGIGMRRKSSPPRA